MVQIQTWQFSADQSIWSSPVSLASHMPHCSTVLPGLSHFSPQKQKKLFFFHLTHFHFILPVCVFVCPKKRICLENLHIVLWCLIKKKFVNNHLFALINLLRKYFCHMEWYRYCIFQIQTNNIVHILVLDHMSNLSLFATSNAWRTKLSLCLCYCC